MGSPQVSLYGVGGHAKVISATLEAAGIQITDWFDDDESRVNQSNGRFRPGIRLAGPEAFHTPADPLLLAIGCNQIRQSLAAMLSPIPFASIVHPTATVAADVAVGEGTVIFAGAVVQPATTVGKHVIINTLASVDHDCRVGDFAHIAPNATLCGGVQVGEATHVGAGATVIESIRVGSGVIIGAGSVVIRDVPDGQTVVGCPARAVRR